MPLKTTPVCLSQLVTGPRRTGTPSRLLPEEAGKLCPQRWTNSGPRSRTWTKHSIARHSPLTASVWRPATRHVQSTTSSRPHVTSPWRDSLLPPLAAVLFKQQNHNQLYWTCEHIQGVSFPIWSTNMCKHLTTVK